jgi:hypothetical protein
VDDDGYGHTIIFELRREIVAKPIDWEGVRKELE